MYLTHSHIANEQQGLDFCEIKIYFFFFIFSLITCYLWMEMPCYSAPSY